MVRQTTHLRVIQDLKIQLDPYSFCHQELSLLTLSLKRDWSVVDDTTSLATDQ
jgi:hypothetical protein